MERETVEFTLPPAPRGLCFDRNDFVKTNFSVDGFLEDHQNVASLEAMRDDLGVYLKVLRLAMIELINKDYANFVNLSATLIGFDNAIEKIQLPLGLLHDQVLSVKQHLDDTMKELSIWLNQRHGLQKKKTVLKYYSQTVNNISTLNIILKNILETKKCEQIALAERAAMQYNLLKFSISKCEILLKPDEKLLFNKLSVNFIQSLNSLLLQYWKDGDENNLLKLLVALASIDKVKDTEVLLRKQVLSPLLQDIVNESALQKSRDGLKGIYVQILSLLDTKLKLLMTVMQHSKLTFLTKQYRFLTNCFWSEVENRIEVNLSSIFAPGNPKIFYTRYCESMVFIKNLEGYCINEETIKLLHETAELKSFQRRWNLPVYFQIRFQEIAGTFELALQSSPTYESSNGFILKETYECWRALNECWSEGVYIDTLSNKFWKLCLQLLSRYVTWAATCCSQKTILAKHEKSGIDKNIINNSISIFVDTQTLLRRLPELSQLVSKKVPPKYYDLIKNSLEPSIINLNGIKNKVKICIVQELYENFDIQLKQVSDIPRLYRKTNRNVPNKPCTYIEVIMKSLKEFYDESSMRLDNAFVVDVFEALFNVMTECYYKYIEDVLTSVQKTEESLRRLKQIRDMNTQQNVETSGVTDGDKIRLQLKEDVVAYGNIAKDFHVDLNILHKYKDLNSMVTEAVKNINIK